MNATDSTPVLRAEGVRKDYTEGRETFTVLRDVSLTLKRGEVVVLEGPSGSGKTTLLSILGCILTPTAGEVFIENCRVDSADANGLAATRKKSIGFVLV